MPAYVIAIREEMIDPAGYQEYIPKGVASFAGIDFKALATYGKFEVVEGPAAESVVIVEFPTYAAAREWFDSPKNQEATALRKRSARMRVIIVDGV